MAVDLDHQCLQLQSLHTLIPTTPKARNVSHIFLCVRTFDDRNSPVQHAVPYPMMMPPGQHVPHPYEGAPPAPVQMGGVGHA